MVTKCVALGAGVADWAFLGSTTWPGLPPTVNSPAVLRQRNHMRPARLSPRAPRANPPVGLHGVSRGYIDPPLCCYISISPGHAWRAPLPRPHSPAEAAPPHSAAGSPNDTAPAIPRSTPPPASPATPTPPT